MAEEKIRGFREILGNDMVKEHFMKAIENHKISHAYILTGEAGMGRKSIARAFAMTLLCEKGGSEPCMSCHSCKQILAGSHPDLIYLSHEKPASIGVDDIREQVNDTIMIRPYSSYYKVYIIDEAEKMTVQAQNALLKTIEEPPEYAVIMLLTENADTLLPTIASRCVMLKLRNIKDTLIKKYLMETMEVPDYKADMCTAFAQGNMGRAILLANSEYFNEIREEAVQLLKYIQEMEPSEIVEAVKRITTYKLEINDYLDIIMVWYRDVLLYKATKDMDKVVFKDQIKYIKEQARKSSYEGIELILESLEKAKTRLKANVNFELAMELLFLTIKEN